jgi:hypothetical protein
MEWPTINGRVRCSESITVSTSSAKLSALNPDAAAVELPNPRRVIAYTW